MNKVNKKNVKKLKKLNDKQCLCECPFCGQTFVMWNSHYYRGSNSCKCKNVKSKRLYSIWINIKTRCCNPKTRVYKHYGGRGIKVCDEWQNNFQEFYYWAINNGYKDDLSIDRINVNGDYTPDNCRWADDFQQARNKTNNIIVQIGDKKYVLKELCRNKNINYKTAHSYYRNNGIQKLQWYLNRLIAENKGTPK